MQAVSPCGSTKTWLVDRQGCSLAVNALLWSRLPELQESRQPASSSAERHISLTPFRKGVADRLFHSALPPPLWGRSYFTSFNHACQFVSKITTKRNSLDAEIDFRLGTGKGLAITREICYDMNIQLYKRSGAAPKGGE